MKILISGINGFIGSNCYRYFKLNTNFEIWGCDIQPSSECKQYISLHSTLPSFEQIFKNNTFDVCLNATGAANVGFSISNPLSDFQLNTGYVFSMLNAIKLYSPHCKFLNLSSAAVYGNPIQLPIKESTAVKPLTPYGWHKYMSECICKEFYDIYKIPTTSLRIFSAFGPGIKKQLFWDLYQKACKESEIKIYGTGMESRDFIYIDDLIIAIEKVILNGKFQGEVLNIASGKEMYIKDAAKIFYDFLDLKKKYCFTGEERKGDPNNWCADISEITKLGFATSYSFEEGIERYISWVKEEK
jgi:UDP-glucose 4-epimerase